MPGVCAVQGFMRFGGDLTRNKSVAVIRQVTGCCSLRIAPLLCGTFLYV
jgi:hypothetical protein